MVIELLYFDGCPNWHLAHADLKEVLAEIGSHHELRLVNVKSNREARRLKFAGSPTVRVDGKDVEPNAPSSGFNLECRLYWVGGKPLGRPPREWLSNAIHQASQQPASEQRGTGG